MVAVLLAVLLTGDDGARVDFETGIMPILTKAGCNAGACHGAAIGRGGFRLSLYGSNPDADYNAIVHELQGRRVNPHVPERSLLFLKATETVEHGGGTRFDENHPAAQRMLSWVAAGMPRSSRRLVRFRAEADVATAHAGQMVRLRGEAVYDDGQVEDVTDWMVTTVADEYRTRRVDGGVQPERAGRHLVIVRYRDRVVPVEIIVPFTDTQPPTDVSANLIDVNLAARFEQLGLPVSPPCDDYTFVRRAHLTLTGRLPTADQIRQFVTNEAADRRTLLIDELLASEACTDLLTWRLAELLRVRPVGTDRRAAQVLQRWLREAVVKNTGYDSLARELVTAVGDSHEYGPAVFHRLSSGPKEEAELVSEVFMGVRLRCANCHDHPLDHWKQDDYHGLAAMFARLDRSQVVREKTRGEVIHPRTGLPAVARLPAERFLEESSDPRADFAAWLTARENPWFARAIVNRLWKWTMGRGLVEPVDDLRSTNPPAHPRLLQLLADDFADHRYDLRRTIRLICTSQAFQRTAAPVAGNTHDGEFFSRFIPQRLPAPVLYDAIADATDVAEPAGRSLLSVDVTVPNRSLDILGRCDRSDSCEADATAATALPLSLHLINSGLINDRLLDPTGRLSRVLADEESLRLERLYLVTLSRPPTADERRQWRTLMESAEDADAFWNDVFWSLLNCEEFTTNH